MMGNGGEGYRTPDLRIASGKTRVFMDHILSLENSTNLPKTLTKCSREQEIDYYELRPQKTDSDYFWQRIGNGKVEQENSI